MLKKYRTLRLDYFGQNPKIFKKFLSHRNQRKILVQIWPFLGVHSSFLTLNKMREKDFEILKILQNLGIKSESRLGGNNYTDFSRFCEDE